MLQQCKCSGNHLGLLPRKQYNWFYSLVVVIYLLHQSEMSKLLYCKTVVNSSITELSSCSVVRLLRRHKVHLHSISVKLIKKSKRTLNRGPIWSPADLNGHLGLQLTPRLGFVLHSSAHLHCFPHETWVWYFYLHVLLI